MKYKNDLRRKNSGTLNGIDTTKLSRNTYYKYKKELFEQLAQQSTTRFKPQYIRASDLKLPVRMYLGRKIIHPQCIWRSDFRSPVYMLLG